MKTRIVVLGAGFGGMEFCTSISEALGGDAAITLVEEAEAFVLGYSKLDVMFGRTTAAAVKLPYARFVKPGVTLLRETVRSIDAGARRVTTDAGVHEADVLVIALGAAYDVSATPGVVLGENEFYSVAGATRLAHALPGFTKGHAVVGVCAAPYKCPPAPSECALMLHDYLVERGVRGACSITLVNPLPSPVPPSPEMSRALVAAFEERGIEYIPGRRVASVDPTRRTVALDDGRELPCELFLGVPRNRAPDVVVATGMTQDGWVTVDPRTLETRHPGVYAIGDLANTGAPKAGVFAEATGRTVAANVVARIRGEQETARNPGAGSCYVEFGAGQIAQVDVDFFSGPRPTAVFHEPTAQLRAGKETFGATRRARWFGA
jgi:sulfide:quinone oxidoreductase